MFRRLVEEYQAAGDDAQRIFVLRMLPEIIDKIVSTVNAVDIEKVSIIDSGGQGSGIPGFMNQLPATVISLAEQLETATGVDIFKSMRPDEPEDGDGSTGDLVAGGPDAPRAVTGGPGETSS